ncbi:MAG: MFS transporter [Bradymonadia bacterium]
MNVTTAPVKKKEIFGWAMYDFANSSFTTVVITAIYAPFFVGHIVPGDSANTYWSLAVVISTVVAMLLAPFAGAVCDYSGRKKRYLGYTTLACALGTMGLYFVGPGDLWIAIGLLTLANAAFMLGESFCASFLTDLATPKTMGIISGLGWGLGYFGGLLSLVLVMQVVSADPVEQSGAYIAENQLAMVLTGVFFLVAAVPTFALVKSRQRPTPGFENASFGKLTAAGFAELKSSWTLVKQYPVLFKFFLAFTVYMAGMEAIIKFVGIYMDAELHMGVGDRTITFIVLQVSAALGALGFGVLESKLGAKTTVLITIGWWMGGILGIYFLPGIASATGFEPRQVFFGLALVAGAGLGSIQSSSRAVVGLLSPPERSAQMFGFWGMFNRVSVVLGMSFGPVSDAMGIHNAMLLVLGFFAVGGVMLWRVPMSRV